MSDFISTAETQEIKLNLGPQHPSTHGVFRLIVQLSGERVKGVQPVIGYLHRSKEKCCEKRSYLGAMTIMDRVDYVNAFGNEFPFVLAMEELLGWEVPERAEYIRVIMAELSRIFSHLIWFGSFGSDTGTFFTPLLYAFREREKIQRIFDAVCGARMMMHYFRPGGVKWDVLDETFDTIRAFIREDLPERLHEYEMLLPGNPIFLERTMGIGKITAEDALACGATGPMLRGCGLALDVRRMEPYSIYDSFDFEIPTEQEGDALARYKVRMREIRQSMRIIDQALDRIPKGDFWIRPKKIYKVPEGEVYKRTESSKGEFGVFLVADGSKSPYRMKIRTPSFANLQTFRKLAEGARLADMPVVIGSLDIVMGEVDR